MTAHAENKSAQRTSVPNYYEEFRLNREDSIETVKKQLEMIRMQWRERASLAGRRGEEAREKLEMIADATAVFENDETREAYELSLLAAPEAEPEEIDWLGRAWSYYFGEDYGAAGVAARLARQADGKNAAVFVISTLVELAEGDPKRAKDYADTAYVFNELGEDSYDVHYVRGETYLRLSDFERALSSLKRAASIAPQPMLPYVRYSMALCLRFMGKNEEALESCLLGLQANPEVNIYKYFKIIILCKELLHRLGNNREDRASRKNFCHLREKIIAYKIPEPKIMPLLDYIDTQIRIIDFRIEIEQLQIRRKGLSKVVNPQRSSYPEFPLLSLSVIVLAIIVFFVRPNIVSPIVLVPSVIWTTYFATKMSAFKEGKRRYAEAQQEIAAIDKSIKDLENKIDHIEIS
jgi:hypothetical protein